MIKIAITGSIASGKTTASKILSRGRGPLFSADGLWIWSGNQWLPSKPSINPDQLTNAYVDIKFDRNQSRNILQMIKSNLELIGVEYKITTNRHAVKGIVESGSSEESHESDFDYVTLYGEEPWQNENSVTQEFETDEQESLLEGDENRGESEERITSDDVSPEELEIIQCPKCENVRLNVPNDYLGRISCPNCSAKFEYPSLEEVSTNYSTSNDKEQINIIAEEILTLIQSLNDAQIQII